MLDKINKCSFLDEESHKILSTVTMKLENLQLQNKKKLFQSTKTSVSLTFDFCFEVVAFDLIFSKYLSFFIPFNESFLYRMKTFNFKDPFFIYFR